MSSTRDRGRIDRARQAQPLQELERKAVKSRRRGYWAQEQIDWAMAEGKRMAAKFKSMGCFDDQGDPRL